MKNLIVKGQWSYNNRKPPRSKKRSIPAIKPQLPTWRRFQKKLELENDLFALPLLPTDRTAAT